MTEPGDGLGMKDDGPVLPIRHRNLLVRTPLLAMQITVNLVVTKIEV